MTRPTRREIEGRLNDLEQDEYDSLPPLELIDLYQEVTLVDASEGVYRLEESGDLRRAEA